MLPCIKISVEKIPDAVSPILKLGLSNWICEIERDYIPPR